MNRFYKVILAAESIFGFDTVLNAPSKMEVDLIEAQTTH